MYFTTLIHIHIVILITIIGAIGVCHKKVADLTKGMDYVLATGNVMSKSGLGLMQVY